MARDIGGVYSSQREWGRPLPRRGAAAPAPAPQPAVDPYDFSMDPALQRIQALGQRTIAEAEADALRQRRQLALDYGDEQAARELGLSEADIAAAKANPFSVRAKQAKEAIERPRELSGNLSKANLGYSSAGAGQQADLARSLLENQSNAARAFQAGAGSISQGLLGARRGVEEGNWQAVQDAATRRQEQMGERSYGSASGVGLGGAGGSTQQAQQVVHGATGHALVRHHQQRRAVHRPPSRGRGLRP
jgi:hypothetical protein